MKSEKQKVVFICTHGIGDLIMTAPTIRLIANQGHHITLFVKSSVEAQVAKEVLLGIDFECVGRDKFKGHSWKRNLSIVNWLRAQKADWILAQCNVNPLQFALLAWLGSGENRIGWNGHLSCLNTHSLESTGKHKVIETARYLDFFGIKYKSEELMKAFTIPSRDFGKDLVVFGPGSGIVEAHKRWPAEKFAQLARHLAEQNDLRIEIIGGPEEIFLCERIVLQANQKNVTTRAGNLNIKEVFSLLRRASTVVANCNGVAHMAVAAGTPVVGLYGPTNAFTTGPHTQSFTRVSLDMDCSPCYRKGYIQGCGNPICMTNIPVSEVASAVLNIIQNNTPNYQSPSQP